MASATSPVTPLRIAAWGWWSCVRWPRAEWAGVSAGTSLAAVGLTTAFGASDELHQLFVPGRSADVHDLVADATGAAAGVTAAWLAATLIRRRKSRIYG